MAVLIISESGAFGGLARLADGDERGLIEVIACNGGDHAAGDGDSARKVTGIDVQRDRHFFYTSPGIKTEKQYQSRESAKRASAAKGQNPTAKRW